MGESSFTENKCCGLFSHTHVWLIQHWISFLVGCVCPLDLPVLFFFSAWPFPVIFVKTGTRFFMRVGLLISAIYIMVANYLSTIYYNSKQCHYFFMTEIYFMEHKIFQWKNLDLCRSRNVPADLTIFQAIHWKKHLPNKRNIQFQNMLISSASDSHEILPLPSSHNHTHWSHAFPVN